MADMNFDAYNAPGEAYIAGSSPGILSRAASWFGAASSVALVIGLGVWGYQLTIRDVTDVPVIRALEGPARVQPDDPGGQLAQHQGLAVNNVQSEGEAEGPTAQVILAPEPIDLKEEDIILASPTEVEAEVPVDTVAEAIGTVVSLNASELKLSPEDQALAMAEKLAEGAEPLEPLAPALEEVPEVVVSLSRPEVPAVDPSVPGVKRSIRPSRKPKIDLAKFQQTSSSANAASGGVVPVAIVDVSPADVASGTRLVQLGAFDDRATAEAEWGKIAGRFEDYMEGKKRLIQEAKSGGRTFFRLRAVGFEDLNSSRRFCAVLVAENAACIPVLAR